MVFTPCQDTSVKNNIDAILITETIFFGAVFHNAFSHRNRFSFANSTTCSTITDEPLCF